MLRTLRRHCQRCFASSLLLFPEIIAAQGLGGVEEIALPGGGVGTIRSVIVSTLLQAVSYVGLLAVVMIVSAGIMLIIYGADEQKRETAKKIIIYTIVGIIVIALASTIVLILSSLFG